MRSVRVLGAALSALGRFLRDHYLSLDPRSLGLFRVALGMLLCADVISRWRVARDFFTNDGLLPNHYALFQPGASYNFSIYHALSTPWEVSAAFALTLIVFVLFLIGYRTRLFHVLSAVLVTSLSSRNLLVEHGGNVVLNILMVVTLFLPLGRRLSVDGLLHSIRAHDETSSHELDDRGAPRDECRPVVSLAVLALILQWCAIYFLNAVQKTAGGWKDGSAVHYFLHQDRLVSELGIVARELPTGVLWLMTKTTLSIEYAIPVLLLLPFWQTAARRTALILAVLLHGGIAATTQLWLFSAATSVFFLMLLGERDWQVIGRWFGSARRARLGLGVRRSWSPPPSANEPTRKQPTAIERRARRGLGVLREALVAGLMLAIGTQLVIDNPWLNSRLPVWQPAWVVPIIEYPRLFQGWRMFAPEPPYEDGRLVVDGHTVDGRRLDVLTGREPNFGAGSDAGWRRDIFWCGYEAAIIDPHNADKRDFLALWLARHHELTGRPQDRLVAFEVWWVRDRSPPMGEQEPTPLPPVQVWSYRPETDPDPVVSP